MCVPERVFWFLEVEASSTWGLKRYFKICLNIIQKRVPRSRYFSIKKECRIIKVPNKAAGVRT